MSSPIQPDRPRLPWDPPEHFEKRIPEGDNRERLICGRCVAQWAFGAFTCPFCSNDDRALITSFATSDGRYRVSACNVCKRYLKAYDGRNASRPVMAAVDTIATLPLDEVRRRLNNLRSHDLPDRERPARS